MSHRFAFTIVFHLFFCGSFSDNPGRWVSQLILLAKEPRSEEPFLVLKDIRGSLPNLILAHVCSNLIEEMPIEFLHVKLVNDSSIAQSLDDSVSLFLIELEQSFLNPLERERIVHVLLCHRDLHLICRRRD